MKLIDPYVARVFNPCDWRAHRLKTRATLEDEAL